MKLYLIPFASLLAANAYAEIVIDIVGGSQTLPEVVVTAPPFKTAPAVASKTGLSQLDAPRNVQAIDKDTVQAKQPSTMFDIVNTVSGVTANSNLAGNRSNYMFRGYNIDDNNGTKINGQYNLTWADLDMRLVDYVEVLKGPSAAQYGKSDPAGFVNVVLKKPEFLPQAILFAEGGNRGQQRYSLDVTGGLGDSDIAGRVITTYSKNDLVAKDAHKERFSIAPSLRWVIDADSEFQLDLRHAKDFQNLGVAGQLMAVGNKPANVPFDRNMSSPNDVFDVMDDSIAYRYKTKIFGDVELNHSAKYQSVWRSRRYLNPSSLNEKTGQMTYSYSWSDSRKSIVSSDTNAVFSRPVMGLENTLVAGFDVVRAVSTGSDYSTKSKWTANIYSPDYSKFLWPTALVGTESVSYQTTWGAYVEDSLHLTDRTIVNAGLRYDTSKQSVPNVPGKPGYNYVDNAVSPNVGITYKVTPAISVFAAYSQSFMPQSPDSNGVYAPPQKTKQMETGVKYDDGVFSASGSLYRLTMNNVATPNPADLTKTIYVGERQTQGFEFDSKYKVTKSVSAIFTYAYTESQITKDTSGTQGNQFADIPRHNASLWVMYAPSDKWGIGVGVRGMSKRYGDNANSFTLAGYGVVDAMAYYNVTRDFKLQANARNIGDKQYYAGSNTRYNIMQGQPFTVSLSAEYRLN